MAFASYNFFYRDWFTDHRPLLLSSAWRPFLFCALQVHSMIPHIAVSSWFAFRTTRTRAFLSHSFESSTLSYASHEHTNLRRQTYFCRTHLYTPTAILSQWSQTLSALSTTTPVFLGLAETDVPSHSPELVLQSLIGPHPLTALPICHYASDSIHHENAETSADRVKLAWGYRQPLISVVPFLMKRRHVGVTASQCRYRTLSFLFHQIMVSILALSSYLSMDSDHTAECLRNSWIMNLIHWHPPGTEDDARVTTLSFGLILFFWSFNSGEVSISTVRPGGWENSTPKVVMW
jgi:hypothetical protein